MPTNEGSAGVGARYYGNEMSVLRGRLTTERSYVDECLECVRAGLTECPHGVVETTDQIDNPTLR